MAATMPTGPTQSSSAPAEADLPCVRSRIRPLRSRRHRRPVRAGRRWRASGTLLSEAEAELGAKVIAALAAADVQLRCTAQAVAPPRCGPGQRRAVLSRAPGRRARRAREVHAPVQQVGAARVGPCPAHDDMKAVGCPNRVRRRSPARFKELAHSAGPARGGFAGLCQVGGCRCRCLRHTTSDTCDKAQQAVYVSRNFRERSGGDRPAGGGSQARWGPTAVHFPGSET